MKYKITLVTLGLLISQIGLGSIIGFPEDMIVMKCNDSSSGQTAVEVYKIGSNYTVGFFVEGNPAGLEVVQQENGYVSPKGKFQNVRLLQTENDKYNFTAYYANNDGSDGEVITSIVELSCSVNSK